MTDSLEEKQLARLHYQLTAGLLEHGACPTNSQLAEQLDLPISRVDALLRGLSDIHGVVLHPHVCEPWVIHPFSLTPTLNWIESTRCGWWAPCIWCALGVAVLAGGECRINSRLGGESESVTISVVDGKPIGSDEYWVHFAVPPAQAWLNVHQHCAMVLPFRNPDAIRNWCKKHQLPYGEPVPLPQVANLARLWYGTHANPAWHKWTVIEAQDIFRQAGLTSPFWNLETRSGKF